MAKKILVLGGANGNFNLGDDAMFEVVCRYIKDHSQAEIVTDSRNNWRSSFADSYLPFIFESFINKKFKKLKKLYMLFRYLTIAPLLTLNKFLKIPLLDPIIRQYAECIKECSLVVFAGMGAMNDKFAIHGVVGRGIIVKIAKWFNVPVIVSGNGIGPLKKKLNIIIGSGYINGIEKIFVRDRINSRKELLRLRYSSSKIVEYIDDAFFLKPAERDKIKAELLLRKAGLDIKQNIIGVNIHNWDEKKKDELFESLKKTILFCIQREESTQVLLIPNFFGKAADDRKILKEFKSYLENVGAKNIFLLLNQYSPSVCKAIVERCDFTIATRYHVGVFSLSMATPTILICLDDSYYVQKMQGALNWYGMEKFAVKFKDAEKLKSLAESIILDRPKINSLLQRKNNEFNQKGYLAGRYIVKKLKL